MGKTRDSTHMRRTKIVATIGPASDSEPVLRDMMRAGMDVARLGLAHDNLDNALLRYKRIRHVAQDLNVPLGILVDLPGPKVRAGAFPEGGVYLEDNDIISFYPGTDPSTKTHVSVDYESIVSDMEIGDFLAFGDGTVGVEIIDKNGDVLITRVRNGGKVQGRPGVQVPSDRLKIRTPTTEDLHLVDAFVSAGVDMVALSFVREADDIKRLQLPKHPEGPIVVAKIETRAAVDNLESIIEQSGAVMVARGDLGSECPIEELPHLQKTIIQRCIALGKPAITATQMLESMVHAATPTRAEASDVANAVFDGTSALMLSGETAVGKDPAHVVATMARIAAKADKEFDYENWPFKLAKLKPQQVFDSVDDIVTKAMSMSAWRAATEIKADAIICISRTGFTVRSIARFRPETQILGFSSDQQVINQLTLSWGAYPHYIEQKADIESMILCAFEEAKKLGKIRSGDLVTILFGSPYYLGLATDTVRIARVP